MMISNFVMDKVIGNNALNLEYHASVDVTTGRLFWKKTERRRIHRKFARYWSFVDTGEFVGSQVDSLERAWESQRSLEQS